MKDLLPIIDGLAPGQQILIAGPCSAENRQQVLSTAYGLRSIGINIFRAGVWKPRTHPGGFEGIGAPALEWLSEVKHVTGMKTATEVANERHVREAVASGIDILWVGARTSANPFAMQEIADTLATYPQEKRDRLAVLVKNPVNPDIELWIGALQRIYGAGIRRLGAIHRGFSSYGQHKYRNEPLWRIPIELHRRYPEMAILCDPSHIGGKKEYIEPLSQHAIDMNFNGLIIESHCNASEALSDREQQVSPFELGEIFKSLDTHQTESKGKDDTLDQLRRQIDSLDTELVEILGNRMRVAREIGRFKIENNMQVVQATRYNSLMEQRVSAGIENGLGDEFMRQLLASIHEESVRQQLELRDNKREE